jgi:hypothetical protein
VGWELGCPPRCPGALPVGVDGVMASLGGSGTRMVPVRQTRLHAVMGLLLVGAVQPVAIAGGQVESVDLLSCWMTYTVASSKGVCCSKALTVGRDQAAHARKGSPRSTLRLRVKGRWFLPGGGHESSPVMARGCPEVRGI